VLENLEQRQLLAWGAYPQLLQQDAAAEAFPNITGAGQSIAILDTGVNWRHPDLGGGYGPGYKVIGGYDFVDNDSDPFDRVGHGTGVATAAAGGAFYYNGARYQGIAPGANIVAVRVDDMGGLNDSRMELALRWVLEHRQQYNIVALNISDGNNIIYGQKTTAGSRYADELAALKDAGVFVAICSGNDGPGQWGVEYPAADPSAYSVGSVSSDDRLSSFSTRGPILNLLAGGENLPIGYIDGSGRPIHLAATGTSFSSPQVAGAVALLKQVDSSLTPDQLMSILKASGQPVEDPVTGLMYRRLDVYSAIALAIARRDGRSASPFSTAPIAAPGYIQVENFDRGGEGVAYHDRTSTNDGRALRNEGPDLENLPEGGQSLGFTRVGEWLTYRIKVATSGTYNLLARVAAVGGGGAFHVEIDGVNKTGSLGIPNTDGWQNWQTITKTGLALTAGVHTLKLVMDRDGQSGFVGNFNWLRLVAQPTSQPYTGVPLPVPGLIEAEKFDAGAAGVAYRDLTAANLGVGYRQTAVDLASGSSGYAVGWAQAGEWLKYTVNVTATGTYALDVRVASAGLGGTFHVELDGKDITGAMRVPSTGSWEIWKTLSRTGIRLTAGKHVLRLVMDSAGSSGFVGNFDWLRLRKT